MPSVNTKLVEITSVKEMMPWFRGNITQAAKHISVNRSTLRQWIEKDIRHVRVVTDEKGVIRGFELL